jgi:acetyltransferase-like isoleucine patch superfamily enzyme
MDRNLRLTVGVLVSLLPFSVLRCAFYKWLLGYSIKDSRIGFATVIYATEVELDGCTIGRFNKFIGPMRISIGRGASIETHNTFDCGEWAADAQHADRYERTLILEADTRVTSHHVFDVAGRFFLGQGSWIAGRGSQFWTHGVNVSDRNVSIGNRCYVGSAVRFAPGSGVGDNVVVGIGSVVTKRIDASNALIAGFPAQVIREAHGWQRDMRKEPDTH